MASDQVLLMTSSETLLFEVSYLFCMWRKKSNMNILGGKAFSTMYLQLWWLHQWAVYSRYGVIPWYPDSSHALTVTTSRAGWNNLLIENESIEKLNVFFKVSFAVRNLLCVTVGDVLTTRNHLPTPTHTYPPHCNTHTVTAHAHTRHKWHPCVLGGGGVFLPLSRLNGGQARQARGRIHATRLFTSIQSERSAVTSAQLATPTQCVSRRLCEEECC